MPLKFAQIAFRIERRRAVDVFNLTSLLQLGVDLSVAQRHQDHNQKLL